MHGVIEQSLFRQRGALFGKSCHGKLPIFAAEADGGRPDLVAAKRSVAGS
jgi:hypothetical protein